MNNVNKYIKELNKNKEQNIGLSSAISYTKGSTFYRIVDDDKNSVHKYLVDYNFIDYKDDECVVIINDDNKKDFTRVKEFEHETYSKLSTANMVSYCRNNIKWFAENYIGKNYDEDLIITYYVSIAILYPHSSMCIISNLESKILNLFETIKVLKNEVKKITRDNNRNIICFKNGSTIVETVQYDNI